MSRAFLNRTQEGDRDRIIGPNVENLFGKLQAVGKGNRHATDVKSKQIPIITLPKHIDGGYGINTPYELDKPEKPEKPEKASKFTQLDTNVVNLNKTMSIIQPSLSKINIENVNKNKAMVG